MLNDRLRDSHTDGEEASSYFIALGLITRTDWERMGDIQTASELLALVLEGSQNRRDTLDEFYEKYQAPSGALKVKLQESTDLLERLLDQVWEIAGEQPLQALGFPSQPENDLYGLVGALRFRGPLTAPQMKSQRDAVQAVIAEFRRQVTLHVEKVKASDPDLDTPDLVRSYGATFLGGQQNSQKRRDTRIKIWEEVLSSIVDVIDKSDFSALQRQLLWARDPSRRCARCGDPVEWPDFHAGHIVPRAKGGRTVLDNAQIEHRACNLKAGAD